MNRIWFFDLDGTLADTDPDIRVSWKAALRDLGVECPNFDRDFIAGPTIEEMARKLLGEIATDVFCGQLRERFPRARIVLATPFHRGFAKFSPTNEQPDESYANELGLFIDDYAAVVREAGQIWAVEVVDLFANSGLHPLTPAAGEFFAHPLSDRLHPSDAGHRRIADALEDAVRRAIRPE